MAKISPKHFANDQIILFPVTGETYGFGSLSETGFSIIQAIQSTQNRQVIVMIAERPDPALEENQEAFQASLRARRLVISHLRNMSNSNVFVVHDLSAMLDLSLDLYGLMLYYKKIASKYQATG